MFANLHTARLTLRPLRATDAEAVWSYRSDPAVARFQLWYPVTVEDARAAISGLAQAPDIPGTWFQLAITLREAGQVIGDCGLHFPVDRPAQAEIGITVAPLFQHRGYATEALKAALQYLFAVLGKHRVYASVDPRNGASCALLERVGMRREGHMRESLWLRGEWVDDVVYAILAREWRKLARTPQTEEGRTDLAATTQMAAETDLAIKKVTAFVVRGSEAAWELLLFAHPHAGVQVPAGTVEPAESAEAAAEREAREETGLSGLASPRYLGCEDITLPEGMRAVICRSTVYARPDERSFDWAHLPRAAWVRQLRQAPGWAQITYEEPDRWPDPQYASYQITGWVPSRVLAARQFRYFYLYEFDGETPERWVVHSDHHDYALFWAPLSGLPTIVPPQDGWLRYLWPALAGAD